MNRPLPFDPVPDEQHRLEVKRARYRAARRWADRLPAEKGEDKAKCYRCMMDNLKAALWEACA